MLVVEYAYRAYEEGKYQAVFWIPASAQADLAAGYLAIAQALKLPEREGQDQEVIIEAIKRWLVINSGWLLILDNVEDPGVLQAFLPHAAACAGHVLLTTRQQAVGTIATGVLEVEPLDIAEGVMFVLRRAKKLALEAPLEQAEAELRASAQALFQDLDGLPLALDQAGAYIEETGCSLADYLARYQASRAFLLQRRGGTSQPEMHPHSVAVTFLLSLEKIEETHRAAADLLRLCAFLAPDAIPEELFRRGASALPGLLQSYVANLVAFDEAIAIIRRYSLIQRLTRHQALGIHRLVQAVIQDDLDERGLRMVWEARAVAVVAAVFAQANHETVLTTAYEPYLPHALVCANLIQQRHITDAGAGHLLFLLGFYLTRHARYEQAKALCQEAVRIYQRMLGPVHPEIAANLTNLAQVYLERRWYPKAQALFEQALSILVRVYPPHPHGIAMTLLNLSRCLWFQGHLASAEQYMCQALPLLKQTAGPQSQAYADGLTHLATVYRDQRKYAQARTLYEQAQQIYERVLPAGDFILGHCLEARATNEMLRSDYPLAETLYQQARAIFEAAVGNTHPDVAGCLCRLADLSLRREQLGQAEELATQALAIYEHSLGPEYFEINQPLQSLAEIAFLRGDRARAEALYQRAIAVIEHSEQPEHPDLLPALYHYAVLLMRNGAIVEARSLIERADAIAGKLWGPSFRLEDR